MSSKAHQECGVQDAANKESFITEEQFLEVNQAKMPTGGSNDRNLEKEVDSDISSKKKAASPFLFLQKLNKTSMLLSSKQCPFKTDGVKQTSLSKTS